MARVIGGIGASHAPSMAHAYDDAAMEDSVWKPLFDGFGPAKHWLAEAKPDFIDVIYNNHLNHFSLENCPTFALGVGPRHTGADEGWGKRALPDLRGDTGFAWHLARGLIDQEFDLPLSHHLQVDHGILSVLPFLCEPWLAPVLPLAVNVIQHPLRSRQDCCVSAPPSSRASRAIRGISVSSSSRQAACHISFTVVDSEPLTLIGTTNSLINWSTTLARSTKADAHLHVQNMLAELITTTEFVRACLVASEAGATRWYHGKFVPDPMPMWTVRQMFPPMFKRMCEIIQTIGAGGLVAVPSFA
ncbi:MAG: hypothetical protein HOI95_25050 [Chromatiales bacterium]|jgi:hypothetical protein|nr:hypothetical protein [Chromatiales bacterium]